MPSRRTYGTGEDTRWLEKERNGTNIQKGDVMECGSYRGIKLMEHATNVLERVVNKRLKESVDIDGMQFGLMKGNGTTYAVWIVRQTQEKC